MSRSDEDCVGLQSFHHEAISIDRLADYFEPAQSKSLHLGVPAGILDGYAMGSGADQCVGQQMGPLSGPAEDDDAFGVGDDTPSASEVIRERFA